MKSFKNFVLETIPIIVGSFIGVMIGHALLWVFADEPAAVEESITKRSVTINGQDHPEQKANIVTGTITHRNPRTGESSIHTGKFSEERWNSLMQSLRPHVVGYPGATNLFSLFGSHSPMREDLVTFYPTTVTNWVDSPLDDRRVVGLVHVAVKVVVSWNGKLHTFWIREGISGIAPEMDRWDNR